MRNSYVASPTRAELPYHLDTPATEYDLNCCFEVPSELSTPGGVKLVPLVPCLHAQILFDGVQTPEIWQYLPASRCYTLPAFLTYLERFRSDSSSILFAIEDVSRPSLRLAGLIGMVDASGQTRSTELGPIIVLPSYQGTHVLTHAAGLMLRWLFEDLKLRRVQLGANELNLPSVKAGLKMGLKFEGLLRWDRVLPIEKDGLAIPLRAVEDEGRNGRGPKSGRHGVQLALCWDDWRTEGKAHVDGLLSRKVATRSE